MPKYSQVIWDSERQQWIKIGSSEMVEVHYGTKAEWAKKTSLVSKQREIYVYTDYQTQIDDFGDVVYIPGIKIGDGNAYVVDLPFINGDYEALKGNLYNHITNSSIHVTQSEKDFWNSKYSATVDGETLNFVVS